MILVLIAIFLVFSAVFSFCALKSELSYLIKTREYTRILLAFLFFLFVFPIAPLAVVSDSDLSDSLKFLISTFYSMCAWCVIGYLIYFELH